VLIATIAAIAVGYLSHTRCRLEDEHFVAPAARLALTPSCSVFATNLRPHSFELVTANRVLHVQGISHDSASAWISSLKAAINAVSFSVHHRSISVQVPAVEVVCVVLAVLHHCSSSYDYGYSAVQHLVVVVVPVR
jgi:hypothetical protein